MDSQPGDGSDKEAEAESDLRRCQGDVSKAGESQSQDRIF